MGAKIRSRTACSCIRIATNRSIAKGWMLENRVPRGAFERLELHEWKHSRAVLRGGGGGNATSLPGGPIVPVGERLGARIEGSRAERSQSRRAERSQSLPNSVDVNKLE